MTLPPSWGIGAEASDKIAGLAGFEEKAVWAYEQGNSYVIL